MHVITYFKARNTLLCSAFDLFIRITNYQKLFTHKKNVMDRRTLTLGSHPCNTSLGNSLLGTRADCAMDATYIAAVVSVSNEEVLPATLYERH